MSTPTSTTASTVLRQRRRDKTPNDNISLTIQRLTVLGNSGRLNLEQVRRDLVLVAVGRLDRGRAIVVSDLSPGIPHDGSERKTQDASTHPFASSSLTHCSCSFSIAKMNSLSIPASFLNFIPNALASKVGTSFSTTRGSSSFCWTRRGAFVRAAWTERSYADRSAHPTHSIQPYDDWISKSQQSYEDVNTGQGCSYASYASASYRGDKCGKAPHPRPRPRPRRLTAA